METFVLTAHIVICVFLVILVLLQSGKEGMGVIFGGGSSSLFGSSGAGGVLAKLTAFVAVAFIVTSLTYNVLTTDRTPVTSVMDSVQIEESAPAAPTVPADPVSPATPEESATPEASRQ